MKKNQILALGAIAILAVSCNGGGAVSTNVSLKTSNDTLSYAYGSELAAQGLEQYLMQMQVIKDTNEIRYTYMAKIDADSTNKVALQKEMAIKIDSLKKANNKSINEFISGLQEGVNSNESKNSYLKGIEIGSQLNQMSENFAKQVYGEDTKEKVNKNALLAGLVSVLKKEKLQIENADKLVEAKMRTGQEKAMAAQEEKLKADYAEEIAAGEKFLAENKDKEGVVTLPSGLQYKIIKEGNGEKPSVSDKVKVHYHGTLMDGTVFDSSVERGEPTEFGVGQVIKGWTEALQLMPAGSKWILYIPYNLAYGARGSGKIGPFAPLVFEVELLEVQKQ